MLYNFNEMKKDEPNLRSVLFNIELIGFSYTDPDDGRCDQNEKCCLALIQRTRVPFVRILCCSFKEKKFLRKMDIATCIEIKASDKVIIENTNTNCKLVLRLKTLEKCKILGKLIKLLISNGLTEKLVTQFVSSSEYGQLAYSLQDNVGKKDNVVKLPKKPLSGAFHLSANYSKTMDLSKMEPNDFNPSKKKNSNSGTPKYVLSNKNTFEQDHVNVFGENLLPPNSAAKTIQNTYKDDSVDKLKSRKAQNQSIHLIEEDDINFEHPCSKVTESNKNVIDWQIYRTKDKLSDNKKDLDEYDSLSGTSSLSDMEVTAKNPCKKSKMSKIHATIYNFVSKALMEDENLCRAFYDILNFKNKI